MRHFRNVMFFLILLLLPLSSALDIYLNPQDGQKINITNSNYNLHLSLEDNSIVAYYPFNEIYSQKFLDYSSNNLHASLNSPNILSLKSGYRNNAVLFPGGLGDYLTVIHNALLSPSSQGGNYSFSFWLSSSPYSLDKDENFIFKGVNSEYQFRIFSDNYLYAYSYLNQDPTRILVTNQRDMRDGSWNHFIYTLEKIGSSTYTASLYQNGVFFGSHTGSGQLDASTGSLYIGSLGGNIFQGMLDELTLYNKTLSFTEAGEVYSNAKKIFRQSGYLIFNNINLHNDSQALENLVSVSLNSTLLTETKLWVQIGTNDSASYQYGPFKEIIAGNANSIEISDSHNLSLRFAFLSDTAGKNTPYIDFSQIKLASYSDSPDLEPPLLNVNFPTVSSYTQNDFPLNLELTLDEPGEVVYSFDNGLINNSMVTKDHISFFQELKSLDSGQYELNFYAVDYAGNRNSTQISFNVDIDSTIVFSTQTPLNNATTSSQQSNLFKLPVGVNVNLSDEHSLSFFLFDARNRLVSNPVFFDNRREFNFTNLTYGNYRYFATVNSTDGASFLTESRNYFVKRPSNVSLSLALSPFINKISIGEYASYAALGDSIEFRPGTWVYHFRNRLHEHYGNSGDGHIALSNFASNSQPGSTYLPNGYSYLGIGPCQVSSNNGGPRDYYGMRSMDGIYTRIGCNATDNANYMQQTFYGNNLTIIYVKEPGAGIMNISINSIQAGLVDANSSSPAKIASVSYAINSSPNQLNSVRIGLVNGDSVDQKWTQINAIVTRNGLLGVTYHRISRGGVGVVDYNRALPNITEDTLKILDPQLVILKLDNDEAANFEDYQTNVITFLNRVKSGVPDSGIILLSYHNTTPTFVKQTEFMINTTFNGKYGFINFYDLLTYSELLQRGYLDDEVHLSEAGGDFYGNYTYNTFKYFLDRSPTFTGARP